MSLMAEFHLYYNHAEPSVYPSFKGIHASVFIQSEELSKRYICRGKLPHSQQQASKKTPGTGISNNKLGY